MSYSSKNLYDQLDSEREMRNQQEIRTLNRRSNKNRIVAVLLEYGRMILVLVALVGVFFWKHDGHPIQDTIDYFVNFSDPNYVNRGKTPADPKKDVVVEAKDASALVPMIDIQGSLIRDNSKYIIFKYNNEVYTLKAGEQFADKYFITEVGNKEIEVSDSDGNFFYYEIPNRKYIK